MLEEKDIVSTQKPDGKVKDQSMKTGENQDINLLWTISTGGMAGGVIGMVLAYEIRGGRLSLAVLLVISIVLISGYTGQRRIIRLIVAGIVAAVWMTGLLWILR